MSFEVILVLIIICGAIVLFATEVISIDLIAMVIMVVLMLTGLVTPAEGTSGFSNSATVTVLALLIISAGLQATGAVNLLGRYLIKLIGKSSRRALFVILVVAGILSAFINNTAVVVIFMPIIFRIAKFTRSSPSKFLMPLSFAAMVGGTCTVIGTSTNILVSDLYSQSNNGIGFGIFEFSAIGLACLIAFILYMEIIGDQIIGKRIQDDSLTDQYALKDYLTEIVITPGSQLAGQHIHQTFLKEELDAEILELSHKDGDVWLPSQREILREGDVILLKVNVDDILVIQDQPGVAIRSRGEFGDEDLISGETMLLEVVVAPNSKLVRKTVREIDFKTLYGAVPLAIRRRGTYLRNNIADTVLRFGDDILLEVRKDSVKGFKRNFDFIPMTEIERPVFDRTRLILSVLITFGVVFSAGIGLAPILVTSLTGCVLMFLTECITIREAYRSVEWKIIFLLAGLIPLGVAIQNSGAAELISDNLFLFLGDLSPVLVVGILFLFTSMLTSIMSNNATAILIAPIGIGLANQMGVDPRAFLIAIMFAASTSFITPVGYQTNTLIYGPGNYRFGDFFKVGGGLTIVILIVVTIMVSFMYL
jgi:di/tricarboxylate transporter